MLEKTINNKQKTNSEESEDRSFIARWSLAIKNEHGYTSIPNLLLENRRKLGITASEFLTLTAILSHKWSKAQPWPSNKTISLRTNCTPRTVRKHVESLEKKGILKRVPGLHLSNVYDVTALKLRLEDFAKSNPKVGHKGSSARSISTGLEGSILTSKEDTLEEDSIIIPINSNEISKGTVESSKDVQDIYDFYLKCFDKEQYQCKLTDKRISMIQARINDCGKDMIMTAIDNTSLSEWYMGANDHGWQADIDYILKSYEQVEKMTNLMTSKELLRNRRMREIDIAVKKQQAIDTLQRN